MNLESKWLEDFSALAATRSFSQAAERRFVTQPAFSRRIRSLEAALGLTLVNRSRTPVELTAAGQLFLVTARTVVEQLGDRPAGDEIGELAEAVADPLLGLRRAKLVRDVDFDRGGHCADSLALSSVAKS